MMRFRPNPNHYQLTWIEGSLLIMGCFVVSAGFWMAFQVEPDPRGFGTHQQFGLAPCRFREFLGLPCPSCGGTTSVAHFVRGEWIAAATANTAVFVLSLLSLAFIPWAIGSTCCHTLIGIRSPSKLFVVISLGLSLLAVVQWGFRVLQ